LTATEQSGPRGRTAEEIAGSVESGIRDGALQPGTKLPSVRKLAGDLGVSPVTVAAAYRTLRGRGLVATDGRRGTKVSLGPPLPTRALAPVAPGVRNLADGNPDPALLPSLRPALDAVSAEPRLYGEQPDLSALIDLARERFMADRVPADAVTVVAGAHDGFERILGAHLRLGDRIAMEDPGHANLLDLVGALGLKIEPVAVDDHGLLPEALERALGAGARALVHAPRAQNPTGAALDEHRAQELRAVLARTPDTLVIEDDHSAAISGAPAHTLVDRQLERWAVVRAVSKTLGPDLRLAVLAGDPTTVSRVEGRRLLGSGWVSGVVQMLVVALWSDPEVTRLMETAARIYAERREALMDALMAEGIRAHGRSGFNVWIPVTHEQTPLRLLLEAGWAVSPGERFRVASPPGLRVTAATVTPDEARRLASDLARALRPSTGSYGA